MHLRCIVLLCPCPFGAKGVAEGEEHRCVPLCTFGARGKGKEAHTLFTFFRFAYLPVYLPYSFAFLPFRGITWSIPLPYPTFG